MVIHTETCATQINQNKIRTLHLFFLIYGIEVQLSGVVVSLAVIPSDRSRDSKDL